MIIFFKSFLTSHKCIFHFVFFFKALLKMEIQFNCQQSLITILMRIYAFKIVILILADLKQKSNLNNCDKDTNFFFKRSISCNHKLNYSKPAFSYEIYPILIIATNQVKDVEAYDIPIFIKIGIQDYILVGMTLHSKNHFILKIFDGKAFFDVDNLNPSIVKNNSLYNSGKKYSVTYVFYEKF